MNGFNSFFLQVYRLFNQQWDFAQDQSLAAFKEYLNEQQTIRMWVDGSPGSGHQASTVGILRQLASTADHGFNYAGRIEVYYNPGIPGNETLPKLQRLMPELRDGTTCDIDNAAVELIEWEDGVIPPEQVEIGVTGGADDLDIAGKPVSPNFAARVNARFFLRLQPYLWAAPDQIQFNDTSRPFIELTRQRAMGYQSFRQRAYFVGESIPEPSWELYADGPYAEQAQIVELLTSEPREYGVTPVYGIRTSQMQLAWPPSDRMFEVITAALASQRTPAGGGAAGAKSVVVISCDKFGDETEREQLTHPKGVNDEGGLMEGGYSIYEQKLLARLETNAASSLETAPLPAKQRAEVQNQLRSRGYRATYLRQIGAVDRVRYLWQATSESVTEGLQFLAGNTDRVLFVQLGKIPEPLFYWLMQSSGWPSVFEGQGTANIALNIGKLYYHVARPGSVITQYPTTVLGYQEFLDVETDIPWLPVVFLPLLPRKVQLAANCITYPVYDWSANPAANPAEGAGSMVRDYLAEPGTGPLHRYFDGVRDFYRAGNNDKLRMGAAFLEYIRSGTQAAQARLAAAGSPALDALLAALNDNLADGVLRVVPGAFTEGGIYDFYVKVAGEDPGLVLAGAAVTPEYADGTLVAITATGSTVLDVVPFTATLTFTAPDGIVVSRARYAYDLRWTLPEIPWIGFRSPFADFYVADSGAPPAGAVGGTLEGADLDLAFQLPVADGKWQLAGSFTRPYPGIARAFQLAGGIDLVRSLPAPFDGLAGFGLQEVQLVYDTVGKQIENVGFTFATTAPFTLVGTVQVRNVTAKVIVQQPADLTARRVDWTVLGTFKLGAGQDAAVIVISATGPDLVLSGSLLSGVLRISDIISAFCPAVQLHPPSEPVITEFQTSFTPATGDYQVSCQLNINWPVAVAGTTIFSIDNIGFGVTKATGDVSGSMRGQVTIGSGDKAVPLELTATYETAAGWTFTAAQSPSSVISLSDLMNQFMQAGWRIQQDYGIAGLSLTAAIDKGSWEFTGHTAEPWTVPFVSGLQVAASLKLGYLAADGEGTVAGYTGRLETTWTWQSISIVVFLDYSPDKQAYGITWGVLEGTVEGPGDEGDWTATLKFTKDTTVGSMVETMVSWVTGSEFALEAPWSVLNSISLSGLELVYTFNKAKPERNKVTFGVNIGPIELGFARIDKISIAYNSKAEQKVAVTLEGSFPWNTGDEAVGDAGSLGPWDASKPGTAPAPPGNGSKYLDLRLLALGQHVTIAGLKDAPTVALAIEKMAKLKPPEPGRIPDVTFDAGSAWIIGADMGILRFGGDQQAGDGDQTGYVLTVQTVFNDPHLYGLRVALAGEAAKVFKGLDFQIMYRQVTDTVGVYQAEITLPDVMRHLSIGVYSVTLPVFAIAVYTNGDFQVDVGFPWNADFTRSFTIEGIIYPGIPVMGSAGFYFGKLSSATTDLVPKAVNGTFNPVLVFGFGLQIGFGKSVEYGVLKAGFSVTAVAIIEGVLGKFNPYQLPPGSSDPVQVQDSYYFWLRGTFGIAARLYGSVDFSVVKAEVNVSLSLMVQLTFEAYTSLTFSVLVSVDVSAKITIDLGLFSISISFSFSMRLKETFTMDNLGTPPWITAAPRDAHLLSGPSSRRLGHRRAPSPGLAAAVAAADRWLRLQPSTSGPAPLSGLLAPGITLAHDEWDTTFAPAAQLPCQVYLMLIETMPETDGVSAETVAGAVAATLAAPQTSFELLAEMVLRWAVAAGQTQDKTPEDIDKDVVTAADLTYLLDSVLVSTDQDPTPISPGDIDSFLGRQFRLTVRVPDGTDGLASATAFPMAPGLRLTAPAYGTAYPGYDYALDGYNALDRATTARLRAYFDQLAVQVGNESEAGARSAGPLDPGNPMSMAQWVQADYFLLLARQMVQAALDSLRDFKYVINGASPQAIISDVNVTGALTGDDKVSLATLFAANPAHQLGAGSPLTVGATVTVQAGDSFETVSTEAFGSTVTATVLACASAGNGQLLRPGAVISYNGSDYRVAAGDSLITVARHFGARFTELLSVSAGLLTGQALLQAGAAMVAPLVTYQASAASTFDSIAGLPAYASAGTQGFTAQALARANAGCPVLRTGERITYRDQPPYQIQPDDTLSDAAANFGVTVDQLLDASGVLTQARLLADVAVLVLPSFRYTVAAGDTLTSLASRFATTIQALAMAPANEAVPGLFAEQDASGEPTPWLDIPHLVQYRVDAILEEARRTQAIRQLSRMAARYAMHGSRLPTDGIKPLAKGIWVHGSDPASFSLPAMAGLYALTGQQINVPAVNSDNGDFTVTIRRGAGPVWLQFAGGADRLAVTVAPGSKDAARLSEITRVGTTAPFDLRLTQLGADPMFQRQPASYPLTTVMRWQSTAAVTLPYGPPPGQDQVQSLQVWALPNAVASLPDPRIPGKSAPRFAVQVATYDEASGATVTAPVHSYGWATTVQFAVKRVPLLAGSPATATSYEIVGASGADIELLERIVDQIGDDEAAFAPLLLAYPPDATTAAPSGLQTDPPDTVTMGIAQVNLSTETRPSAFRVSAETPDDRPAGLLNTKPAFIRLLWEASITRNGGFYLYYYDAADGRGLPDRIFNDRGEAHVWLVVLYANPGTEAAGNRVQDYMTSIVTGDSIDTSRSVIVAAAAPMEAPVPAAGDLTLSLLAARTYSDLADLAEANQALALATGVRLTIEHGLYQAPPGGISLAAIVAAFGLGGVAELNAANPRWTGGLPDPLSYPVAINLPVLTVTAGTSPRTASLADIAGYYGTGPDVLAAANADVPGIFATGQQIAVPGGPYQRNATVPPGAAAVVASRAKPDEVPLEPRDDYARLFLENTFSLLGYQVAGNVYFTASNVGLPAGPTTPAADVDSSPDKVRAAAETGTWEYRQSFGYPGFAIAGTARPAGLPPAGGSPYRGLGSILQVDFSWLDFYGNMLVTNLTTPRKDRPGPVNQPPMLTGYTDPLVALSQWPSAASAWRVSGTAPDAVLELVLTFDPSRYQGLIRAAAVSPTQIQATFTSELDPASAAAAASYKLDGGIGISSATLGGDRRTVTLTTDRPLTEPGYVLSVSGISGTGAKPPVYWGSASFPFPEAPGGHSSTVTQAAARDLTAYTSLYYQLTDANGIAGTVTTSLLTSPVDLGSGDWTALLGWLYTGSGDATSVYGFLADRAQGQTTTAAPPATNTISVKLPAAELNTGQIYELSVAFTLRRTGGAVLGSLETTPGIRTATTVIAPLAKPLPPGGTAPGTDTLGLAQFAADFEAALSVRGKYQVKVAVGINRAAPVSASGTVSLWAVRLGTGSGEGISYHITDSDDPRLFAPRPMSNQLQSHPGVAIYDYATGSGISPTPSRYLDFVDIDLDVWGRMLLAAVDETLSPEFVSSIRIVSARTDHDYLADLLAHKQLLATAISQWMIPLYEGEHPDPGPVREAFYQQLLSRLSNAYNVSAGITFSADVTAGIDDPAAQYPPRLFGAIQDQRAEGERRGEITLTSPKLPLQTATGATLPFLLSAPETVDADGTVVGSLDLDLTWQAASIEHQIAEPSGITGYVASSWLTFVLPGDTPQLVGQLGGFPVPLVLRAFPASPVMTGQTGKPEHPDATTDLDKLTVWAYTFTWSLPFHYVQDRVHGMVEFNQKATFAAEAADTFGALAEFVTVYPKVRQDLVEILARVDATTTDETQIDRAAVAVGSFAELLGRITGSGDGPDNLAVAAPRFATAGDASLTYSFEIIEGGIRLPDPDDPSQTVTALLVTIDGAVPPGIGTPAVQIDPDRYQETAYPTRGDDVFSYYYVDMLTGEYLLQADGQRVPARTVRLPGLDILQRQDAWAGVHVTRNEQILPGKPPTAEPFVYTTPQVRFADPLLPTIDSMTEVSMAQVGSGGPVRSLDGHLTALFGVLFADMPADVATVTIQVEAVYSYRVNQALDPVELPIFLQAPLTVVVNGDQPGTRLAQMVTNWTRAISSWFTGNTPNPADGTLRFDLAILSDLTEQPMPLLRLRNLRLAIADVVPPLDTRAPHAEGTAP